MGHGGRHVCSGSVRRVMFQGVVRRRIDERWRGSQDEAGVATLTRRLQQLRPHLVIMEASGGYERITATLGAPCQSQWSIHVQVRDFARSLGRLAKTDRIDAEVIAHFGRRRRGGAPGLLALELEALVTRRQAGSEDEGLRAGTPPAGPTRRPVRIDRVAATGVEGD